MKVLYFSNANLLLRRSHVYSVLKTSEALARELAEQVAISSLSKGEYVDETLATQVSERQKIDSSRIRFLFRRKGIISSIKALAQARASFDVFYYRTPLFLIYAFIAKRLFGKKVVVEIHRMPKRFIERILWDLSFRNADRVIFITHALLKRNKKYEHKSSVVFCNTLDPEFFLESKTLDRKSAQEMLDLPKDKTLLVYAGNTLDYVFDALFEALALVDEAHLIIVGSTTTEILERLAREKGVEKRLTIVERTDRNKVPAYLFASDILVVPFVRDEPGAFPVKIYEYMAAKRPIISFSSECIREVLRDRENGILIEPTAENWARAIREIVSDKSLAEKLSRKAKEESGMYTWEARGRAIADILKK